jgi:hypothetical protein
MIDHRVMINVQFYSTCFRKKKRKKKRGKEKCELSHSSKNLFWEKIYHNLANFFHLKKRRKEFATKKNFPFEKMVLPFDKLLQNKKTELHTVTGTYLLHSTLSAFTNYLLIN